MSTVRATDWLEVLVNEQRLAVGMRFVLTAFLLLLKRTNTDDNVRVGKP